MLSSFLPKFVVGMVDMGMLNYHPRRRGERFEKEIEGCWLENSRAEETRDEKEVVHNDVTIESPEAIPEVIVGLSVRYLY